MGPWSTASSDEESSEENSRAGILWKVLVSGREE